MGAWGTGIYENDDAADWGPQITDRGLAAVEAAFDAVLDADYVEAPDGNCALAAADVLARLISGRGEASAYCNDVAVWVATTTEQPSAPLIVKAAQVLARLRGDDPELAELWSDDEASHVSWLAVVEDVEQRLAS